MSAEHLAPELKVIAPIAMATSRPMWLLVSLHNPTEETLLVNGRMVVGRADGAPDRREIDLKVSGPGGVEMEFTANTQAPAPGDGDFVEIPAGGQHMKEIRIDAFFDMKQPGRYSVTVSYSNSVAMSRGGAEAFVGKVDALPVRVVVGLPGHRK